MTTSLCRQLTAIILLVVVLLAPLTSIAHDYASEAMQDACVCQLLPGDDGANGENPAQPSSNEDGDCCDHEECCSDAMEPPPQTEFFARSLRKQPFQMIPDQRIPEVYLAIFVPPES